MTSTEKEFEFPSTLEGEPYFESTGDSYEGPIPRVVPSWAVPAPAGTPPTVFRLHRVSDHLQMVELTGYGDASNFAYDPPPGHTPQGLMQWYWKRPGSYDFTPFGPEFQYKKEKDNYWERNGL